MRGFAALELFLISLFAFVDAVVFCALVGFFPSRM
jgi:hypothetical protein